jgi:hypothetical protein
MPRLLHAASSHPLCTRAMAVAHTIPHYQDAQSLSIYPCQPVFSLMMMMMMMMMMMTMIIIIIP